MPGEIRRHPPFATLPVRYTRSGATNFTDATRSAPAPKCAGGVNFAAFSGIPASRWEGWSETIRVAKHGTSRTRFARRAGLRHMLVILNTRHEDSLFSKINKFASLTSVDARKNGKNERCDARRPARAKPPGILRHMLVILNIRHEDSLFSKINVFASLDSGRAGVRASRGAEDGSPRVDCRKS